LVCRSRNPLRRRNLCLVERTTIRLILCVYRRLRNHIPSSILRSRTPRAFELQVCKRKRSWRSDLVLVLRLILNETSRRVSVDRDGLSSGKSSSKLNPVDGPIHAIRDTSGIGIELSIIRLDTQSILRDARRSYIRFILPFYDGLIHNPSSSRWLLVVHHKGLERNRHSVGCEVRVRLSRAVPNARDEERQVQVGSVHRETHDGEVVVGNVLDDRVITGLVEHDVRVLNRITRRGLVIRRVVHNVGIVIHVVGIGISPTNILDGR